MNAGSGTRTFVEADHYEASLRQAQIVIVIALNPKFKARLTAEADIVITCGTPSLSQPMKQLRSSQSG